MVFQYFKKPRIPKLIIRVNTRINLFFDLTFNLNSFNSSFEKVPSFFFCVNELFNLLNAFARKNVDAELNKINIKLNLPVK